MAAISRPSILVTNDDGIDSEGIAALAQALGRVGQVRVVAPRQEMSASSHSISLSRPLRYEQVKTDWYAVHGTPADAVIMALNHIIPEMPDMVFSGINKGSNLGANAYYSGTVGAAVEGTLHGIPAIAISICARQDFQFEPAADFAARLAGMVLEGGLPAGVTLNVNVPDGWSNGARLARQGTRIARNVLVETTDPKDRKYYWMSEQMDEQKITPDSDYAAVRDGHIAITPLTLGGTEPSSLHSLSRWVQSFNALSVR